MKKVKVLLSTYNGEPFLEELLNSLFEQRNVEVSLLVRDDGSSDNTLQILKQFREQANIEMQMIKGNNIGYLKSFWELINLASDADYYALCDQDDFWCPEKLICAVTQLVDFSEKTPALYTSNVISVDENLKRLNTESFPVYEIISFADSLKRSVLPGCTFVFNNALLEFLKDYKGKIIVHDWIIYLIAKAVGKVVYDREPHILYRLHGDNTCGTENGIRGLRKQIKRFKENKTPCARSQVAHDILCFKNHMSIENIVLAENFSNYKNSFKAALYLLKYKEYRNIRFLFMMALKRI